MIIEIKKGKHGKGKYYVCKCDYCGKRFERMKSEFKGIEHQFCNQKCYGAWKSPEVTGKKNINFGKKAEEHNTWKGGRTRTAEGYVLITKSDHPNCDKNGYMLEHRLLMEKHLGRYLDLDEVVHHENKIVDDNRIENLILFENSSKHQKYHWELRTT